MRQLSFLTQTRLVQVSSSNTGPIDDELIVSRLLAIKLMDNFEWVFNKNHYYLNIPCSFDIETTSFTEGLAKKAIMYAWTLNINGTTFFGRTWEQYLELIDAIATTFQLDTHNRLLIYVHNLEYEFQFMRKWIEWHAIFADDKRKPLYAVDKLGIEYRCSYRLSGYSLAKLADELQYHEVHKMVGDLDYSKIRHSETPLTEAEMNYCIQDTIVVVCYIQEEIDRNGNIAKIPYTNTGYVRRYCRNATLHLDERDNQILRVEGFKYHDLIASLTLNSHQYRICKDAFQGGFTHANVRYVGKVVENVGSIDFTSSYPYTMVAQYFPMSSPKEVQVNDELTFMYYRKLYCCAFVITFYNIRPTTVNENPISSSRCSRLEGYHINNGRVIDAEVLTTTITELDYEIYQNFYKWDSYSLGTFLIFQKGYLPSPFVASIINLYRDKTELKGVEGKEVEYLRSKGMLNSAYGMCVTDIVRDELDYVSEHDENGGWIVATGSTSSQLARYNRSYGRFLYYPWGVWVTAHARHNLFKGILAFGDDYVYSDTDSIKAINMNKHQDFIEAYNDEVRENLRKAAIHHKLPLESFEPKTIKGEPKLIGVWDFEGTYSRFKTLGAKRYLTEKDGKLTFTVAGVNKKAILQYMLSKYTPDEVFEKFTRNLEIPPESTGKMTHTYIDKEWEGWLVDYTGIMAHYYEKSSIHLSNAAFKISMLDQFWDYVEGVQTVEI